MNSTSRTGNLMNVNAYAANAAIRSGMNVAGRAIARLLMNAWPILASVDRLLVVVERQAAEVPDR